MDREILILNIDKIHTTLLGGERIRSNLMLGEIDAVLFCKNIILDRSCNVYRRGKNYYCDDGNIVLTVNAYSYTIITAHIIKGEMNRLR